MKLKNAMAKNFARIKEITVNFDPLLTYICGVNKSGKSTIGLSLIWFVFQGLAQKGDGLIGERFRFIGPAGKSAQGRVEIYDEKDNVTHIVTRKLTKDRTELAVISSDGAMRGQEFLNEIFDSILINPFRFSELSGKEQVLALGISTAEFDSKLQGLRQDRLLIGREVKKAKGVAESFGETEPVEEVSITDLVKELEYRTWVNTNNLEEEAKAEHTAEDMERVKHYMKRLREQIEQLKTQLEVQEKDLIAREAKLEIQAEVVRGLEPDQDEEEIRTQIAETEETNAKARLYAEAVKAQKIWEDKQAEYDGVTGQIDMTLFQRSVYVEKQELPLPDISITEDGEFRLQDRPFCSPYFSTGERLKLGVKLGAAVVAKRGGNRLDYVWIPDCQNLDEDNRQELFEWLAENSFQVVCEYVSKEKQEGVYSILLTESREADDA